MLNSLDGRIIQNFPTTNNRNGNRNIYFVKKDLRREGAIA